MPGRVIEILTPGFRLSKERGFVRIQGREADVDVRIPLTDMAVLIAGDSLSISTKLIVSLHKQGATLVITGSDYHPCVYCWPQPVHNQHGRRLARQIGAGLPMKKRLWRQVVHVKIVHQASVLASVGRSDMGLMAMSRRVRSGDPDNMEAQAARRYWPALLGACSIITSITSCFSGFALSWRITFWPDKFKETSPTEETSAWFN